VGGVLAPHPPHLVYAENPPQNEPRSEGGWEVLRWGYERLRKDLERVPFDVLVVLSPHWPTYVGTHVLALPRFEGLSVDPVFPNLFRYRYAIDVDVELAKAIEAEARGAGLVTALMTNPDFRVDYGTIVSCHMVRPAWDLPIVAVSSCRSTAFYSVEVMQEQAKALGEATRRAVERSGRRALLLSSSSLSHRHFTVEPDVPEDMSREHVYNHHQYLWDMRLIGHLKAGRTRQVLDEMPEFVDQAVSEADAGSLTWLLSALRCPERPAEVYAYGNVIGTGNAVAAWLEDGPPSPRDAP
jgi:2-aminophenol/2-amino-5-chlorophenol 1,6-dioxygenase beta subunit